MFRIRLTFERGGGCLWCGNEGAVENFGVGPLEDVFQLSDQVRRRLVEMSIWHDRLLSWVFLPASGHWPREEIDCFDSAANQILVAIQGELGADFDIVYERLLN